MLSILRPNTYKAPLASLTSDFYDFRVLEDETAAMLLAKHIWRLLKKARHRLYQMPGCEGGAGGVSVLVPADFLNRLSRDVVRMTEGERHGVRGCTLHIDYCDGLEVTRIGKIKCDPHLPSSSFLHLTLTRAPEGPRNTNPLLRILGFGNDNVIYISPGYLLEKKRSKDGRRVAV
ncbi:protein charybde-like [Homarus americanus]|uniref:Charybde-like n=1 Tax=Homarus americanus TaxID=6706 RepID=A0A8J5MKL4_HOMAM|nr:protein charybde-like [Homarus americanus]KAG7154670.1 charybde-like [Homarus americanus]